MFQGTTKFRSRHWYYELFLFRNNRQSCISGEGLGVQRGVHGTLRVKLRVHWTLQEVGDDKDVGYF